MCIYQVLYMYKIVTWLTTLSNTYQQAHWKFFKDKCHLRSNMHMYMHHTANHWACYPLGRCSVKAEIEVLSPSSEQQGHVIPFIATRWQVPIRSPCLWRWLIIPPAAAAAKSLQSCPTLCHAIDGSPPLPSLGFSRQEHWSGLPFPSPMHESEKWKWSRSIVFDS